MKIGLALGGGGARGLAHIPVLQVLDELGIRPHCVAGTSIGAIMGAIYASGVAGSAIREGTDRMLIKDGETLKEILARKEALSWIRLLDIDFLGKALFKGDAFVEFLYRQILTKTFEELKIPLKVVATDFWNSTQVVFERGDLLKAIKASMGLPGVFSPVHMDGRILIDGGCVNPLPHDILCDCDIVIAVNVIGRLDRHDGQMSPTAFRAVLETFNIMQRSIISEKLAKCPPTIYIEPVISNVDLLDFHKAPDIYAQGEMAARELRKGLLALRNKTAGSKEDRGDTCRSL